METELLEGCAGIRSDRRLFRAFTRWKTAARRRNEKALRWVSAGLSERLLRADPDGLLLRNALSRAQKGLSASRDAGDLRRLFELHRAFADYRTERSRFVAQHAHIVERLVATSRVHEQDREDVLHEGIVRLAAAPAMYRPDASPSFEAFARAWLKGELGLAPRKSAA